MSTERGRGEAGWGFVPIVILATIPLLTSTASSSSGRRPLLASIRFTGNSAVSEKELLGAAALTRGDTLSDPAIARTVSAVLALYGRRSYFGARAEARIADAAPDSSSADLLVSVSEGAQARIGRIDFAGLETLPPERAAAVFGVPQGEPLTPGRLEEGLSSLLAEYDRAGFPLARVSIASVEEMTEGAGGVGAGAEADVQPGSVRVVVGVEEGQRVDIAEFRVKGNTETRADVILRESRMDLPEPYEPSKVSRFAERLRRLGLFSSVEEPSLYLVSRADTGRARSADGTVEEAVPAHPPVDTPLPSGTGPAYGLLIAVREGSTSTFDGVAGYAPAAPGESGGSFTGSASVSLRNLFGTGRRFDAGWSRDGRSTQEIRLSYEEPWAFGFPVNLGGGFSQRQQDSSFVDRRVSLSAEFLASASLSVAAVGEEKRIIPASGAAGALIPGSRAVTGGVVVRYDTRDDRVLPRRGVNYRSEYRTGKRNPSGSNPVGTGGTVRHLGFDVDFFVPFGARQVLDLAVHGREISTASPEPGDLYRLGGFRTMRGFREDRFSGTRTAWGTAEYRFIAEGKSFFFGFIDPGYVQGSSGAGDVFTFGYGLGARLETSLGLVGVSFALGRGDPVSETKIHFGLINDF